MTLPGCVLPDAGNLTLVARATTATHVRRLVTEDCITSSLDDSHLVALEYPFASETFLIGWPEVEPMVINDVVRYASNYCLCVMPLELSRPGSMAPGVCRPSDHIKLGFIGEPKWETTSGV